MQPQPQLSNRPEVFGLPIHAQQSPNSAFGAFPLKVVLPNGRILTARVRTYRPPRYGLSAQRQGGGIHPQAILHSSTSSAGAWPLPVFKSGRPTKGPKQGRAERSVLPASDRLRLVMGGCLAGPRMALSVVSFLGRVPCTDLFSFRLNGCFYGLVGVFRFLLVLVIAEFQTEHASIVPIRAAWEPCPTGCGY